jgi:hypothetical protein
MTKLEALGLVETTTNRQRKNGTRAFFDSLTNCTYLSYSSGYIRRSYIYKDWQTGNTARTLYQLNPTKKTTKAFESLSRSYYTYKVTERILIDSETERLDRLARAVANYRITVKKYEQDRAKRNRDIDMMVFQDSINQYFEGNLTFEMAVWEIRHTLAEISTR